jgi:hypothetical protein
MSKQDHKGPSSKQWPSSTGHKTGGAERMQAPPPDGAIFIDFVHADRDRIRPLVAAIEARGYPVWMDESVESGVSWEREIERIIASAACVVLVLTADSLDDPSPLVDAARAGVAGKLLAVRLDPVPLPVQLASAQAVDLTDWDGQAEHPALSRLLAAIERVSGPTTQSPDQQASHKETALPRARCIRIPDIAWVEIPGGPFLRQDGEGRELPTFWIAK